MAHWRPASLIKNVSCVSRSRCHLQSRWHQSHGMGKFSSSRIQMGEKCYSAVKQYKQHVLSSGNKRLSIYGPTMWNSLPAALRLDMSLSVFYTWLKTFLMSSYNACNSHGSFAAFYLNLCHISDINDNNNNNSPPSPPYLICMQRLWTGLLILNRSVQPSAKPLLSSVASTTRTITKHNIGAFYRLYAMYG